jgi:SAM-dependent methyltransferase
MASIGHRTAFELLRRACPGGVVLDVGAYPGHLAKMLAPKGLGYRVVALDKKPDRGLTLQSKFHEGKALDGDEKTFTEEMAEIGVECREADIEVVPLPVADESADAALLTEVIEHLFVNPLLALTEINRALKPGGVLLLSTPNLLSLRNRFNMLRGQMGPVIQSPFGAFLQKIKLGHCGHVRTYAPDELADMLRKVGFEVEFHFRAFDFWDPAPDSAPAPAAATTGPAAPKRSIFRKLFRSPASYARAGVSTARALLEKAVPQFRPHMFVIARKVRPVGFRDLETLQVAAQQ